MEGVIHAGEDRIGAAGSEERGAEAPDGFVGKLVGARIEAENRVGDEREAACGQILVPRRSGT